MEQVDKLINEFAEQIRKELKNGKRQEDNILALATLIEARAKTALVIPISSQ